jgi:hypothetical protein
VGTQTGALWRLRHSLVSLTRILAQQICVFLLALLINKIVLMFGIALCGLLTSMIYEGIFQVWKKCALIFCFVHVLLSFHLTYVI